MNIRKLEYKDIPAILSWMHDDDITRFFSNDFSNYTENDIKKFIDTSKLDKKNIHLACVDDNDSYLGTVSLKNIDTKNKNAEYAVSFCKSAHGTGCSKFATYKILEFAFNELNLERVYLNVLDENIRANKFYKKIGFIFEGSFKKHIYINNELKDLNWYRLLKSEFNGKI